MPVNPADVAQFKPYIPGQKLGPGETLVPGPNGPVIVPRDYSAPPPPPGQIPGALPPGQLPSGVTRVETTGKTTAEKFGKKPPSNEILSISATSGKDRYAVKVQVPGQTPGVSEQFLMTEAEIRKLNPDITIPKTGIYGFGAGTRWAPSPPSKEAEKIPEELKDYPLLVQHAYQKGGVEAANTAIEEYKRYVERFTKSAKSAEEKRIRDWLKADAAFKQQLSTMPKEIQDAYYKGGAEGYETAVSEYIDKEFKKGAEYITIGDRAMKLSDWKNLYHEYQLIALKDGWDAMFDKIEADYVSAVNRDYAAKELKKVQAWEVLQYYVSEDGEHVDIQRFLEDANKGELYQVTQKDGTKIAKSVDGKNILREAEFTEKDISQASYQAKLNPAQKLWQGMTPWEEAKGEKATPAGGALMAAELLVPGVFLARHWSELSPAEKAIYIAVDALILLPSAKAGILASRAVAGTATRRGVMIAAGKAALKELGRTAYAPINVLVHPVGTAKAAFADIRNLVENIAHPKKIPSISVYTSEGTVRLTVKGDITEAKAIKIRDALMEAVARGERPIVRIGDMIVELNRSALMKELPGSLTHTTPMGDFFKDVLKVSKKPGMPLKEQGLFVAPDPLPRFAEASAFGKPGTQPTFWIMSPETAQKTIQTGKVYNSKFGTVVEMERKLPVGKTTKPVGQKLFTRIGPMGTKVEIWLEEGTRLSKTQIARLKAKALIEWVKAPFEPALKVRGKFPKIGISQSEVKELATVLRRAGATRQADDLLRAERLIYSYRATAPRLLRMTRATGRKTRFKEDMLVFDSTRVTPRIKERTRIQRRVEIDRLRRSLVNTDTFRRRYTARRPTPARAIPRVITVPRLRAERRIEDIGRPERPPRGKERPERETARAERIARPERPERGRPGREPVRAERITARERARIERLTGKTTIGRLTGKGKGETARIPRTDAEKREIIKEAKGLAVAYVRGHPHGKGMWHVWYQPSPGVDPRRIILYGPEPEGARIEKGLGSAKRSMQQLFGKAATRRIIQEDTGAVDTRIELGGKTPKISFERDIISSKSPRISPRTPRITPKVGKLT